MEWDALGACGSLCPRLRLGQLARRLATQPRLGWGNLRNSLSSSSARIGVGRGYWGAVLRPVFIYRKAPEGSADDVCRKLQVGLAGRGYMMSYDYSAANSMLSHAHFACICHLPLKKTEEI